MLNESWSGVIKNQIVCRAKNFHLTTVEPLAKRGRGFLVVPLLKNIRAYNQEQTKIEEIFSGHSSMHSIALHLLRADTLLISKTNTN